MGDVREPRGKRDGSSGRSVTNAVTLRRRTRGCEWEDGKVVMRLDARTHYQLERSIQHSSLVAYFSWCFFNRQRELSHWDVTDC
jgi:hypothetical protein